MSKEAIDFKSSHKNINFSNLSLAELNKLPPHNGIYNFKISNTSFLMLNIINDDSSVVKHFWKGSHDLEELDLWFEISSVNPFNSDLSFLSNPFPIDVT